LDIDCDSSSCLGLFIFSNSLFQTVSTALLDSESPDGHLLFRICDLSFADVSRMMAKRVLDRHLSIVQFAGLLFSLSTEQMSETISLLTLADCIAFKCVSSDLTRQSAHFLVPVCAASGPILAFLADGRPSVYRALGGGNLRNDRNTLSG
jgi:hypothetical protein